MSSASPGDSSPVRVVLIDGQELFRRGLALLIETEPGVSVLGQFVQWPTELPACDVVVSDVPTLVNRESTTTDPPILILTDHDHSDDLNAAIRAGAAGYLLKDCSVAELHDAIQVVADGQSLISPAIAMRLLDKVHSLKPADLAAPRLTEREQQVLRLMATGSNNKQIAAELVISENTVKNHVSNILEKLQLHSRMAAVMFAVRQKMLDLPQ